MSERKGNIAGIITNAAIFIILEIAALGMLSHNGKMQNLWFARGFFAINARLGGSVENVHHYFNLKQENDSLAMRNFELSQKLREYQLVMQAMQEKDNTFIQDLSIQDNYSYIPGCIIRHSQGKQHNFYIVDKGQRDGIGEGDGIITQKGIVGIVEATSEKFSYVMTYNNTEFTVSTRLGHDGPVGPLKWNGKGNAEGILSEIPCHIDISPGDTVYTSGFSSIFPADIPLGTTGDMKIVNGATYEIDVRLFEDISKVRYVTVVSNRDKYEIEQLEQSRH